MIDFSLKHDQDAAVHFQQRSAGSLSESFKSVTLSHRRVTLTVLGGVRVPIECGGPGPRSTSLRNHNHFVKQ
jgi:hypothetical protein